MLKCLEKKKTNFNVVVLPLSQNDLKENGSDQEDIFYSITKLSDMHVNTLSSPKGKGVYSHANHTDRK